MDDMAILIRKVLVGQATQAERDALEKWISDDAAHAEEFSDWQIFYGHSIEATESLANDDDPYDEGLQDIRERIKRIKRARDRFKRYGVFGVALAITIAIVSAFLFVQNKDPMPQTGLDIVDAHEIVLKHNIDFDESPISEVLVVLERDYEIRFVIGDEAILSSKFTGTFSRGTTIEDVLRVLGRSENFSYTVTRPGVFELHHTGADLE